MPQLLRKFVDPYWVSACGRFTVYCADCSDVINALPWNAPKLLITDPPYGISLGCDFLSRGRGLLATCNDYEDVAGDGEPYDPTLLLNLGLPTVLWGANHFCHKVAGSSGWLVWDKKRPEGIDQADCELAWTNFVKGVRIFRHTWHGMMRASEHGENYHPTQKPVALFDWLLGLKWVKDILGTVVDPYMGSGPLGVACVKAGREYVGVELVEGYCKIAVQRIRAELVRIGSVSIVPPQAEKVF